MPRVLAALLLMVLAPCLPATSLVLLDEATLTQRADRIVRAVVLSSRSAYRSGAVPVFTDVALEVAEVLKGDGGEPVIHVALPGGELDGRAYRVPGTPAFHPGEEVLVFLVQLSTGEETVLGFGQGKYRLEVDPDTGLTMASRRRDHLNLVPRDLPNRTQAQALRAASDDYLQWDVFRRRLKDRVREGSEP